MNKNYLSFLERIKNTIQYERTKATQKVNRSLIALYWEMGKQIVESQKQHGWGKSIVEQLSQDLQEAYPSKTGFSARNLWDMRRFYETYKSDEKLRQLVAEIPWGHNLLIMQKAKSKEERQYYILASNQMGWSRGVLLNQIKAKAFQRQVQLPKQTNFEKTLPKHLAEQADETIKSSYNLEFLGVNEPILELELENKLLRKLRSFILELGYGFAFIGNQYPITLGDKTYRIDLLFYHRHLQCLVAIDLKIGSFAEKKAAKKREEKRHDDFMYFLIRSSIQKALERINEAVRFHAGQMEKILEEITEAEKRLEELKAQEKALRAAIKQFEDNGMLELCENGQLSNKWAEAAVRSFEGRAGEKVDRSDPLIYEILLEAIMLTEQGRGQVQLSIEENTRNYERHKKEKEKTEAIRAELESGDPGRCLNALQEMDGLDEIQHHEITRYLSTSSPDQKVHTRFEPLVAFENKGEDIEAFSFGFPDLRSDFSDARSQSGERKKGQPPQLEEGRVVAEQGPIKPKL